MFSHLFFRKFGRCLTWSFLFGIILAVGSASFAEAQRFIGREASPGVVGPVSPSRDLYFYESMVAREPLCFTASIRQDDSVLDFQSQCTNPSSVTSPGLRAYAFGLSNSVRRVEASLNGIVLCTASDRSTSAQATSHAGFTVRVPNEGLYDMRVSALPIEFTSLNAGDGFQSWLLRDFYVVVQEIPSGRIVPEGTLLSSNDEYIESSWFQITPGQTYYVSFQQTMSAECLAGAEDSVTAVYDRRSFVQIVHRR